MPRCKLCGLTVALFLNYCGSVATHSLSHCVLFCNDTVPESEALVAFFLLLLLFFDQAVT